MSVTFSAEGLPPGVGEDGEWDFNELEVNMSNVNAVRVAETLGFRLDPDHDGDLFGAMDATEFMGHVLVGLALAPADEGMPAHELAPGDPGRPAWAGDARWIEGGRHAGYMQDRLEQLRGLAQWAVDNNAKVVWS